MNIDMLNKLRKTVIDNLYDHQEKFDMNNWLDDFNNVEDGYSVFTVPVVDDLGCGAVGCIIGWSVAWFKPLNNFDSWDEVSEKLYDIPKRRQVDDEVTRDNEVWNWLFSYEWASYDGYNTPQHFVKRLDLLLKHEDELINIINGNSVYWMISDFYTIKKKLLSE